MAITVRPPPFSAALYVALSVWVGFIRRLYSMRTELSRQSHALLRGMIRELLSLGDGRRSHDSISYCQRSPLPSGPCRVDGSRSRLPQKTPVRLHPGDSLQFGPSEDVSGSFSYYPGTPDTHTDGLGRTLHDASNSSGIFFSTNVGSYDKPNFFPLSPCVQASFRVKLRKEMAQV